MNRILLLVAMATLFFTSACQGQTSRTGNAGLQKKKVLIISSSPSKGGNSDLLCDEFLRGAKEAGHEAEKVFLGDLDIRFLKIKDDYTDRNLGINDDTPLSCYEELKGSVYSAIQILTRFSSIVLNGCTVSPL